MNSETIEYYLDQLNNKNTDLIVAQESLSSFIDFCEVKCLNANRKILDLKYGTQKPYLIKGENGRFVGLVQDAYNELHWYHIPSA